MPIWRVKLPLIHPQATDISLQVLVTMLTKSSVFFSVAYTEAFDFWQFPAGF